MHITKSSDQITPFGGLNFCMAEFSRTGLPELVDQLLGSRGPQATYCYSDLVANWMGIFFTGGDCAEDIGEHLSGPLSTIKGIPGCSPDTLLRGIKELSCDSCELVHPTSGVSHTFNINPRLNDLLVKSLSATGQLIPTEQYDLDYDNQVIFTEKWDAQRTYKQFSGYQPGIASINNLPVFIEGRGGNSQAMFGQADTLRRVFNSLDENDVHIDRFRADSGSYLKEVIEVVTSHTNQFYIRARRSEAMAGQVGAIAPEQWKSVRLGVQKMDVAETSWTPFGGETSYRLILSRIKRKDNQGDLFSGGAYTWRAILTNDQRSSPADIVAFYNQRGASERVFDTMNNDFGWSRLPCSWLSENTTFMILTAMIANFYHYLIELFSKRCPWIESTWRLKKFIFRFISVPGKWIRSGRRVILKLFTHKAYESVLE